MRYEDLIVNMRSKTEEIMEFLGLGFEAKTEEKVKNATNPQKALRVHDHEVKINPDLIMNKWRYQLPLEEVLHIQNSCDQALKVWGFKTATKREHLSTKDLVGNWYLNRILQT